MTKHSGLPVKGYVDQADDKVGIVNWNKEIEERVLRQIDELNKAPDIDKRWLSIARTQIEQGFMALNRSVFCPERVELPEDGEAEQ